MARLGPSVLSSQELIATLLGAGNKKRDVLAIAQHLLSHHDIRDLSQMSVTELKKTFGIDTAKACRLLAAFELGKRSTAPKERGGPITSAGNIAEIYMPHLQGMRKEVLLCLYLNTKLHPLREETVSVGGLNTNSIAPADVFRPGIAEGAAGVILIHNHPSGDPEPSTSDIAATKRLMKAGTLVGIEVLDHIVIGESRYVSMKEAELL